MLAYARVLTPNIHIHSPIPPTFILICAPAPRSRVTNPTLRDNILSGCKAVSDAQPVMAQSSSLATHMLEKADFNLMQVRCMVYGVW